jgi:hypothetical protein
LPLPAARPNSSRCCVVRGKRSRRSPKMGSGIEHFFGRRLDGAAHLMDERAEVSRHDLRRGPPRKKINPGSGERLNHEIAANELGFAALPAQCREVQDSSEHPERNASQVVGRAKPSFSPRQRPTARRPRWRAQDDEPEAVLLREQISPHDPRNSRFDDVAPTCVEGDVVVRRACEECNQVAAKPFGVMKEQNIARQRTQSAQSVGDGPQSVDAFRLQTPPPDPVRSHLQKIPTILTIAKRPYCRHRAHLSVGGMRSGGIIGTCRFLK